MRLPSFISLALATVLFGVCVGPARAQFPAQSGKFIANDKPVDEFHCVPKQKGRHPAVILLHGATPRGVADNSFKQICSDLAENGYFAEFVEYYSQTEAVGPGQLAAMLKFFTTWVSEIDAAVGEMQKNPAVDSSKVALLGYSLGGALALSEAAADSSEITAVVDYYGPVSPILTTMVAHVPMPPTLILHGDKDSLVPVAQSTQLADLLERNSRPHEIHVYPGAEHAFNFPGFPSWYNETDAKDAWTRTVSFLDRYLKHPAN